MSSTLDSTQYTPREIRKYEAIYGRYFVSPGGEACARECIARLGLERGDAVLDVGCGLGGAAFLMASEHGARVHGIDVSANMIALATANLRAEGLAERVTFTRGDCLDLADSRAYRAVYSRDVFLHIEDKPRLFAKLLAVLEPAGRLLFTDYCRGEGASSDEFETYVAARGYHLCTLAGYAAALREAGFDRVESEDWTGRFVDIHRRELERLPTAGLEPEEEAELRDGWQRKIARAERGEQRWGLFTANCPRDEQG